MALSIGMFDGVHRGHQTIIKNLNSAAQNKDLESAILTFWPHPRTVFNPNDDLNYLFFDVFIHPENTLGNANFNYAYGYYRGDVNMNGKVKFDNPNDDKNLLYAQILFHPLNIDFLSNFNDFIEQIP